MTDELIYVAGGGQPLSRREEDRLMDLEQVIERNFKGFYAVGKALMEINETRLYRQEYKTFKDYLKHVWEMGKTHGYRFIEAANVVDTIQMYSDTDENVPHGGQNENPSQIIINERQARELAKLPAEDQVTAWTRAVETAPDGKVTARHIRACIKEMSDSTVQKAIRKTRAYVAPEDRISKSFKDSFDAFLDAVNAAILSDYKETSKTAVLRHIAALIEARSVIESN